MKYEGGLKMRANFKKKLITLVAVVTVLCSVLTPSVLADAKNMTVAVSAVSFKDVKKTDWYYNSLDWASKKGIVKGYTDGTFKPNNRVTEAEFLSMLMRSYEPTIKVVVKNEKGRYWAEDYYIEAGRLGYKADGIKEPSDRDRQILRGDVADLITSSLGKSFKFTDDSIDFLLKQGLANGKVVNGKVDFDPASYLTRAEAVEFIRKVNDAIAKGKQKPNTDPVTTKPDVTSLEGLKKEVEKLGLTVKEGTGTNANDIYIKENVSSLAVYGKSNNELIIWTADKENVVEAARLLLEHMTGLSVNKDSFVKAINSVNENAETVKINVGSKTLVLDVQSTRYTINVTVK
jgi:hypothetical protein